jgi:hypothetical protein
LAIIKGSHIGIDSLKRKNLMFEGGMTNITINKPMGEFQSIIKHLMLEGGMTNITINKPMGEFQSIIKQINK